MPQIQTYGPKPVGYCSRNPDIPILLEDDQLLVIRKPAGILSQADRSGDPDLLSLCKAWRKAKENKSGDVFLGLVHRLDRPVSGVMVLARTSGAAASLSEQIRQQTVRKEYLLICIGKTPPNAYLSDFLVKDQKQNRSRVVSETTPGSKRAELHYTRLGYDPDTNHSLLRATLMTGRPHQIRVQLSASGYPLRGDQKYGGGKSGEGPALFAFGFRFRHPVNDRPVRVIASPPDTFPWTLFSSSLLSVFD